MIAPSMEKDGLAKYNEFLMDELEKQVEVDLIGIEKKMSLIEVLKLARRASEYDIVHVQYTPEFWGNIFGYFWGTYFPVFARLTQSKIVMTAHEYEFKHENPWIQKIQRIKMRRTFLSCDRVIVHNDKGMRYLKELSPDIKSQVIPHGVPSVDAVKNEDELDIAEKVVMIFGFVRRDKDYEIVIDAVSELQDYKLLIAGAPRTEEDEEYHKELKGYIKTKNAENGVIDYGYVADEDIPKIFNTADVSVLPYEASDGSGVLALSIGYDVPILMSDIPLAREIGVETYSSKEDIVNYLKKEEYSNNESLKPNRQWSSVANSTKEMYCDLF